MEEKNRNKILVSLVAAVILLAALGVAFWTLSGSSSEESMDLKIAYSNKVDYEPLMIASALGYFKEEGVNVTTLIVSGGIQSAEALSTGSAEMGAMGDAPGIILMAKADGSRLVARYAGGEGMHRMIAQANITELSQLVGKKIGVQLGSSSQGALIQLMEKNGIDITSFTTVPLNPPDMPSAMKTKQVDAIMASEPFPTNVEKSCGNAAHDLANSSGLGNNFPLVLMVTKKALEAKPKAVEAALRAIDRAIAYIHSNYGSAATLCANKTGLSVNDQQRCMDSLFYDLDLNSTDMESLNQTAQFLLDAGKISAAPNLAACMDLSFLKRIRPG